VNEASEPPRGDERAPDSMKIKVIEPVERTTRARCMLRSFPRCRQTGANDELRRVFEAGDPAADLPANSGGNLFPSANFHVRPQQRVDLSLIPLAL
jgi:hypothetical protein